MSITKTIDIFCDACNVWDHGNCHGSVRDARKSVKKKGWLYVRVEGKMVDLCPNCANIHTLLIR